MKIFRETLIEEKNKIIGFFFVTLILLIAIVGIYPGDENIGDFLKTAQDIEIIRILLSAQYGEGGEYRFWLALMAFSFIYLVLIFLPGLLGTTIFASEQDNNRLDLLISMPISRQRIFLEKWFLMACISTLLTLMSFITVLLTSLFLGFTIPTDILLVTWIQIIPLQLLVGTIGGFLAIYYLNQFKARLLLMGYILGSFFLTLIANVTDALNWLQYINIFHYYNGSELILQADIQQVSWTNPLVLMMITLAIIGFTIWWLKNHDLIPHYEKKNSKTSDKVSKDIPVLFFYVSKLRNKRPSLVEQIQADRLILNIFMVFMFLMGLVPPAIYPGDAEMIEFAQTFSSNILFEAILQNRPIVPTVSGWMVSRLVVVQLLFLSLFILILGPRLFTRDIKAQTVDLLICNPLQRNRLLLERISALGIEFIVAFVCYISGATLGLVLVNQLALLPYCIIFFLIGLTLFWFWAMIGVLLNVIINNNQRAFTLFIIVFLVSIVVYMLGGVSDTLFLISKYTPFFWFDPYAILVDHSINLETIGPGIVFIILSVICITIMLVKIGSIDMVETYQEKLGKSTQ